MRRLLVLVGALAVVAAACGSDGDAGDGAADSPTRTVQVEMRDIDFDPATVAVERGETVRFVFTNAGSLVHDAFLGDAAAQEEHERAAREGEGGHDGHGDSDGDAITVDPGESGELVHTFDEAGEVLIGCHEPGHYDAGMRIRVSVD